MKSTMHDAFEKTAHREWPAPRRPWVMAMRWHDLLFAHWRVPAEALRPLIPTGLQLDTFDGDAWLGVVPFRMSAVRPRGVPPALGLAFPELNLRTYVSTPGRPGVWFFSLDATSRLSVRGARLTFGLPYFDARMDFTEHRGEFSLRSVRTHRGAAPAALDVSYRPVGAAYHAEPGSLDYFLTERYALYSVSPIGRLRIGEIHHHPWPLQRAEASFRHNAMTQQIGLELPREEPLLHFAAYQEVLAWRPALAEPHGSTR